MPDSPKNWVGTTYTGASPGREAYTATVEPARAVTPRGWRSLAL